MWIRTLATLSCLSVLGCAPALREVRTGEPQAFATAERCAQGPLRLSTTFDGARWGEYVRMSVASPRALAGRVRVLVDDRVVMTRAWHTGFFVPAEKGTTRYVQDVAPANQHCVERPPAAAADGPATRGGPISAPTLEGAGAGVPAPNVGAEEWAPLPPAAQGTGASAGGVAPSVTSPSAGFASVGSGSEPGGTVTGAELTAQPTAQVTSVAVAGDFVPTTRTSCGEHQGVVFAFDRVDESRDGQAPFKKGAKVQIEIWSETPNDFEGACFFAQRGTWQPSGSEAEWLAELDKREADRVREEHVREVERRNQAARRHRDAVAEVDAHNALCAKHPEDVECRHRVFAHVTPPRPAPVVRTPAPKPEPKPRPPTSAPPPPVQSRPQQPVSWAEWIPGYWQWSGFEWVWLDGWWKVDQAKLAQVNATATTACPAPKREAPPPPPPSVKVQWHAGQWLWAGLQWVWLPGQWRAPVHAAAPARK